MQVSSRPTGKRHIPINAELRDKIRAAAEPLAFARGILFGRKATHVVRTSLGHALLAGIAANGVRVGPTEETIHVHTGGLYDSATAPQVAGVLLEALRAYLAEGVPSARALDGRPHAWLDAPRTVLPAVAVNAFAARRASEVELAETLEEAMRRELRAMREAERLGMGPRAPEGAVANETLEIRVRLDARLFVEFREAASRFGYEPESLLWRGAREVAGERRERR